VCEYACVSKCVHACKCMLSLQLQT